MPKVSKAHSELRRRQILDAAVDCFSEFGFHHTTMRDIVRKSGLSPGAIYLYFESKDQIIEEIARERHARERDAISRAIEQGNATDSLLLLAEVFFGALRDRNERKMRRLGVQLWAEALRDAGLLRIVHKGIAIPRKMLAEFVARGQNSGEFPSHLDPDAVARVFIALFQGFVLQQAWDDRTAVEPFLAVVRTAFEAMMRLDRPTS